jgi:hypothetical protein
MKPSSRTIPTLLGQNDRFVLNWGFFKRRIWGILGLFRSFGEDELKTGEKRRAWLRAAEIVILRPCKAPEINNSLAASSGIEQYHQMC